MTRKDFRTIAIALARNCTPTDLKRTLRAIKNRNHSPTCFSYPLHEIDFRTKMPEAIIIATHSPTGATRLMHNFISYLSNTELSQHEFVVLLPNFLTLWRIFIWHRNRCSLTQLREVFWALRKAKTTPAITQIFRRAQQALLLSRSDANFWVAFLRYQDQFNMTDYLTLAECRAAWNISKPKFRIDHIRQLSQFLGTNDPILQEIINSWSSACPISHPAALELLTKDYHFSLHQIVQLQLKVLADKATCPT